MLPWKINYCMWACGIMGIGKVYRFSENEIDKKIMKPWIVIISTIIYFSLLYLTKDSIVFWGSKNWVNAFVVPATGMICMIYLSKKIIVNNKILLFIGTNTLVYFALHRQILHVVESITGKLLMRISFTPTVWTNIIEVCIIALLLSIPTLIINKYIPQITGKGWKLWNVK